MSLNTHFDHIYCLNLLRRPDRKEQAQEQFNKYGVEVEWFPAIDGKEVIAQYPNVRLNAGELGIVLSNIEILKDAKAKGYKTIAVIEDDIVFGGEMERIDTYFNWLPQDWQAIYLSSNANTHNTVGCNTPPYPINSFVVKMHNSYSTHFVGLKAEMFDIIIEQLEKLNVQLDVEYKRLQERYNWYCFKSATGEPLAQQRIGYSDIVNQEVDYNWLIK